MTNKISTISRPVPYFNPRESWLSHVQSRLAALPSAPVLILTLIGVGLLTHALHMFHYPAFTLLDDEGIYTSQAWAVLRQNRLAPYTYFYDHAPAGWILLAGWMWLTGGLRTFGGLIDSGRVFMLLLHLGTIPLVFHVTRKLTRNVLAATLAAILFSVSPLGIFYQRLVLLDNIMIFWLFLSLDLLLDGWGRLSRMILSGVCFGLACLTKETAIFILPAFLFLLFQQRWQHTSRFAISGWLIAMAIIISWYPLYALLKGELLPPLDQLLSLPSDPSTNTTNVSLIGTLKWQLTRSGGGPLNLNNQFWYLVQTDWLWRDPLLLVVGTLATAFNLLAGIRRRHLLAIGLLGALPLFYLARGGVVFNYYILFAIPFLALNLAVVLATALVRLPKVVAVVLTLLLAGLLVLIYTWKGGLFPLYWDLPDQSGREAITWIKQNLPAESMIITRDTFWTDLHEPGPNGPGFPNVHSHYKVAQDPEIRYGVFKDDWQTVDYLLMSPDLDKEFASQNNTVALEAFRHAHLVKRWESGQTNSFWHRPQVVELWKVDKAGLTEAKLLADSTAYMKNQFEQNGAYVDGDGAVTSEAQSYAMLRAIWSNDREGFYKAWAWTQANLLNKDTGLPVWLWRDGQVVDPHTASDADTDIALALLMAGKHWNDPSLIEAGGRLLDNIWAHEVVMIGDQPYLTAGDWATQGPELAINPSYFSPYAYRIFQEVDHDHNWLGLVETGYKVLFAATESPLGTARSAGLPPDWIGVKRDSGEIVPLQLKREDTRHYGYDAARTYWRMALDQRWSNDGRADAFLNHAFFLRDEVNRVLEDGVTVKNRVSAVYAHDGTVVQQGSSMVSTTGAASALLTLDPPTANILYAGQIIGSINRTPKGVYWENPNDLYTQEWGWFMVALYADAMPDLWHAQSETAAAVQ